MNRGLKIVGEVVGIGIMLLIMWATVQSFSSQSPMPVGMDIESIVTQVNQYCTGGQISGKGTCNSLLQKLQGAIEARDRGQPEVACNKLNAFSNEVQAQSGKKVDPAAAQVLINMVTPLCSPAPTVTPTAIVISPLPTPTAIVISPLPTQTPPKTQTILFTVGGAKGQELYKMAIDNEGNRIGEVESLNFSAEIIRGLYPSPDNKRVAIWEYFGEGGTRIHILNKDDNQITPLFGVNSNLDQQVGFLSWSSDGQKMLVLGAVGSDLRGSVWVVDVNTFGYIPVDIKQRFGTPSIPSAIFSLDNSEIIYTQSRCYQCGSQIWRVKVDGSQRQMLFEDTKKRVEDLTLSPNGNYLMFMLWLEDSLGGDLYVMDFNGSNIRLLSPANVDYFDEFTPLWSKDSQKIIFNKDEIGKHNLYNLDIQTNLVTQLTSFEQEQPFKPTWSSDKTKLAFLTSNNEEIKTWVLDLQNNITTLLGIDITALKPEDSIPEPLKKSNKLTSLIWLP